MSKSKEKKSVGYNPEHYEKAKAALTEFEVPPGDRQAALAAGQDLCLRGLNTAAVHAVVRDVTGQSFNFKQLTEKVTEKKKGAMAKPGQAAGKAVQEVVQRQVVNEAMLKIQEALATGKSLEDGLKVLATQHGFADVPGFVMTMYGFWETWRNQVQDLVQQVELYKEVAAAVVREYSPDAVKAKREAEMWEMLKGIMVIGHKTGQYPPGDVLKGMIQGVMEVKA